MGGDDRTDGPAPGPPLPTLSIPPLRTAFFMELDLYERVTHAFVLSGLRRRPPVAVWVWPGPRAGFEEALAVVLSEVDAQRNRLLP